ncbi:MAG: hypothetical protein Q4G05_02680 [Clostridia bacterium]|nr:hypothetical protein [Clostridia bacterium]
MSEQNAKSDNNPRTNIYCVGTQMAVTDRELEILSYMKGIETRIINDNNVEIVTEDGFLGEDGFLIREDGVPVTKFSKSEVKKLILKLKEKTKRKKNTKDNIEKSR